MRARRLLPLLQHLLRVILGVVETRSPPLALPIKRSAPSKQHGKIPPSVQSSARPSPIDHPSIRPSLHPSTYSSNNGMFGPPQPITFWSFSGNCYVLLQRIRRQLPFIIQQSVVPGRLRCELWLRGPDLKPRQLRPIADLRGGNVQLSSRRSISNVQPLTKQFGPTLITALFPRVTSTCVTF